MLVDERQLSDFLIDSGLISRGALADARARAQESNETLYHTLLRGGVVDSDHLRRAAAHTLGVPFVILSIEDISPDALVHIPEPVSRTHNVVAFRTDFHTIEVALLDLDDLSAVDFLQNNPSYKVVPRLTDSNSIKRALIKYQQHLKEKFGSFAQHGLHAVDALIKHAIYSRAGGIHIEPSTTGFLIRYRIGEMLHEAMQLPEHVGKLLVEQLKSLAKVFPVNAAQEGHFTVQHDNLPTGQAGETYSVHLSTMPIHKGEKLVMRLSRQHVAGKGRSLESLGFHGESLEAMHEALRAKSGLIVVAGDNKEQRMALLYTLLELLNQPHRALASVEEQVHYHVPHVAQGSTTVSRLSYPTLLRSTLKRDADVVMVSTINDGEVANIALEAASQGKLILVGVEASTAAAGVEELLRFGVSPLTLASTLRAAAAVGTVRKICPHCRGSHHRISRQESSLLEETVDFGRVFAALKDEGVVEEGKSWKEIDFYWPEGCSKCEKGYLPTGQAGKGEVGLGEVVRTTAQIKEMLLQGVGEGDLETIFNKTGGLSLAEDALFKAAAGETSIEEVLTLVKRPI